MPAPRQPDGLPPHLAAAYSITPQMLQRFEFCTLADDADAVPQLFFSDCTSAAHSAQRREACRNVPSRAAAIEWPVAPCVGAWRGKWHGIQAGRAGRDPPALHTHFAARRSITLDRAEVLARTALSQAGWHCAARPES